MLTIANNSVILKTSKEGTKKVEEFVNILVTIAIVAPAVLALTFIRNQRYNRAVREDVARMRRLYKRRRNMVVRQAEELRRASYN